MISQAYSLYDSKSLQYHLPFYAATDGAAIRMVSELVNDKDTMVGRHPVDFHLYRIGHYDDALGGVYGISPLVHVIDAVALVRVQSSLFPTVHPDNGDGSPVIRNELNGEAR